MERIKYQMEANFYGVIRCMKEVLPSMRENKEGRIQVVSSVGGLYGQPFNDVYCASKFAVEGLFESMAPLYQSLGIHLSIIEPGAIATNFVTNVKSNVDISIKMDDEIMKYLGKYMERSGKVFSDPTTCQTPMDVAKVCFKAVTDENPNLRYQPNQHQIYTSSLNLKYSDLTGNKTVDVWKNAFK